tara:strand:- start:18 stop:425 length:408 start_codon:yes stop_codon:yes gene_type:complete
MLDSARATVKALVMVIERAIERAIETATVILLAMAIEIVHAAKVVQLLRERPVAHHRHRVVVLVVLTQKVQVLTVAARAIAAAVPEIALTIAVPDLRHGVMHRVAIVVRNSVAHGANVLFELKPLSYPQRLISDH